MRFYVPYVQKYHESIRKPSEGQKKANKGILEQKYRTDKRNCDKIILPCEKLFIILIVFLCFNVEGTPWRASKCSQKGVLLLCHDFRVVTVA